MAKQTYADNVDANGKVFKTVGDNIREGARAGELLNFQEITDKIDALEPEISTLQDDVAENRSDIKKNSDNIVSLNEDLIYKTDALKHWNLADISKVKENCGYTNAIGYPPTLVNATRQNAIDYVIPCKAEETYTVNWLYGAIGIYDSDIKRIQHIYIDTIPKTFSIPTNGSYMTLFGPSARMSDIMLMKGNTLPEKYVPYEILDVKTKEYINLFGVKWCAYGNSLTDSATLAGQPTGSKNYVDYVSKSLELNVVNCGVAGTGFMNKNNGKGNFVDRVSTIPVDTKILTVFGSFNDYDYITEHLGTIGDTGTDTIYGAMHKFIQDVYTRCPDVIIGIITPTKWGYLSDWKDASAGGLCDSYVEALLKTAEKWSIPVLDLYHDSGLRPWDTAFAELYYKDDNGDGTADTVHPLDPAHKKFIAPKVEEFIKTIYHVY